jgi:hypothetical protein
MFGFNPGKHCANAKITLFRQFFRASLKSAASLKTPHTKIAHKLHQ